LRRALSAIIFAKRNSSNIDMKTLKTIRQILCVIAILTCSSLNSTAVQAHENEYPKKLQHEFELRTNQWKEAYNSGDAQNLVALYSQDAIYISSHVKGLEARGRDQLIAYFQQGMSGGGHVDAIEILTMEASGGLATLLCKYQATNSGVTVVGRNLLVMKNINGNWVVVVHMTVV
jgi:ketosteroid isomerase-like protein